MSYHEPVVFIQISFSSLAVEGMKKSCRHQWKDISYGPHGFSCGAVPNLGTLPLDATPACSPSFLELRIHETFDDGKRERSTPGYMFSHVFTPRETCLSQNYAGHFEYFNNPKGPCWMLDDAVHCLLVSFLLTDCKPLVN